MHGWVDNMDTHTNGCRTGGWMQDGRMDAGRADGCRMGGWMPGWVGCMQDGRMDARMGG